MLNTLSKFAIGAALLVAGAAEAQAQRGYYDSYGRYTGRYTTRRPVYDNYYNNGRTTSIVTQTPQGPVRSSSTVDSRTGEEITTTYWRDPATGQVTTSRRVVDPRTGRVPSHRVYDHIQRRTRTGVHVG